MKDDLTQCCSSPSNGNSEPFINIKPPSNTTAWKTSAAWLPNCVSLSLKSAFGIVVVLYVLNQKHMLPKPLSAVVSHTLFWPTLPITFGKRVGRWMSVVDDSVIIGGAPFSFAGVPKRLFESYGVRGVINMCIEYKGPKKSYNKLGMEELWLPTVDHFEPKVEDLERAVEFIQKHKQQGSKVYIHCRAGHGRSAAAVFAWLLSKDPTVDRQKLNEEFCKIRDVRKSLWKQPNLVEFHSLLQSKRNKTTLEKPLE